MIAVTFKTEPEGARVETKTRVYGTTPQPAKLTPGTTYELTFTKSGYASASKTYVAPKAARGPQTLRVSLKKLSEPKKSERVEKPTKAAPSAPPSTPHKGWFSR
jgi:hypothetical protein